MTHRPVQTGAPPIAMESALACDAFAASLGVVPAGREELELPFAQHLIGDLGAATLHSGAIAGFLDVVVRCTVHSRIAADVAPIPRSRRLQLMQPVGPWSLIASCTLGSHRAGIISVMVSAREKVSGKPVAVLTGSYELFAHP